VVLWLSAALAARAQDPALAGVRIKSHGANGTVIATGPGKSYILSCAHMFLDGHDRPDPALQRKRLVLDGPEQPRAVVRGTAPARLVAVDFDRDLSLIELDNGPFAFVPVAKAGHVPSKNLLSMGYDEMKWPITQKRATLLLTRGNTTYTQEWPWHGRSGGALVDLDANVLIGVVQGYETDGPRRGLYVSHGAVLTFLTKARPQLLQSRQACPQ
jgi:hypothetical protein